MKFTSVDKFIVQHLLVAKSAKLFDIHKEKKFSPFQLQDSVTRLTEIQIIKFDRDNMTIALTPEHEILILKYRHLIFNRSASWRKVPESYIRKRLT